MSGKIEISRELAERVVGWYDGGYGGTIIDEIAELRALLAAPVVKRKPPIAYMRNEGTPNNLVKCTFLCDGAFGVYREPQSLSADPPAPVAVVLPERKGSHLHYDSLMPTFSMGWNACLDKAKELNQ